MDKLTLGNAAILGLKSVITRSKADQLTLVRLQDGDASDNEPVSIIRRTRTTD